MESGILYSVLQARAIAVGQDLLMLRVSDEKSVEWGATNADLILVFLWVGWN